jgi:hypothetical protein
MATLNEIVRKCVEKYAVRGINSDAHLMVSPDGLWLSVIDVATDDKNRRFTSTSLIVHLMGDRVVIEHDDNNKPLVDALMQVGIPREKIILAYAGEPVSEAA